MFPYPNGKSYLDFKDEAKNKLESFIPLCAFLFGVSSWVGWGKGHKYVSERHHEFLGLHHSIMNMVKHWG